MALAGSAPYHLARAGKTDVLLVEKEPSLAAVTTAQAAGLVGQVRSTVERVNGCLVVGRYSIQRGTSAETAARIASGERTPRLRQYLFWNSKKIAKSLGGGYYITMRKSLLRNLG